MMKLYTYFRSSASFRLRIALNLKGVTYESAFVHLRRKEHLASDYRALNPAGLVPTLTDGDVVVTQSLAALEYLDARVPEPRLVPSDPADAAFVRSVALAIACDIHPLNNLRVLQYLAGPMSQSQDAVDAWYRHWVVLGFEGIERQLAGHAGRFAFGDTPTLADVCIVPQVFNAMRFDVDINSYPTISRVHAAAMELDAFSRAAPELQPDAVG